LEIILEIIMFLGQKNPVFESKNPIFGLKIPVFEGLGVKNRGF